MVEAAGRRFGTFGLTPDPIPIFISKDTLIMDVWHGVLKILIPEYMYGAASWAAGSRRIQAPGRL